MKLGKHPKRLDRDALPEDAGKLWRQAQMCVCGLWFAARLVVELSLLVVSLVVMYVYSAGPLRAVCSFVPGDLCEIVVWSTVTGTLVLGYASWVNARYSRLFRAELARLSHPLCWKCKYDLRGLGEVGVCPECGTRRRGGSGDGA